MKQLSYSSKNTHTPQRQISPSGGFTKAFWDKPLALAFSLLIEVSNNEKLLNIIIY